MEDLHLRWDRKSLEELIRKIIPIGETTKVDLKSKFDLSDTKAQADFLKDICAIANTYSGYDYEDHGFIIFGAQKEKIIYTTFPKDEDHLQATIDDLVKKYLGPFIKTHLYIFKENEEQWGVLVIPPTRNAPHVFIKDTQLKHSGDVYVRNGTTTNKAQPEDYARFFRQHLEDYSYKFQQSIGDMQRKIQDLDLKSKKTKSSHSNKIKHAETTVTLKENHLRLNEIINETFSKVEDPISTGLLEEVKKINNFLATDDIPWLINSESKDQSEVIFRKIENVSKEFWSAVTNLVLRDKKGIYEDALVKAITHLSILVEPPSGLTFTDSGKNIRYYPLFVTLYLICISGVAKRRNQLLKKIFSINLQGRSHYKQTLPITYILFLIRNANSIFHPLFDKYPQQRWCDPIASYTELLVNKILIPDDPFWDQENEFYKGEYLLCLAPLNVIDKDTKKPMLSHPSAGLYIFMSAAVPIINRFLHDEREWIKKVYDRPLENMLTEFDNTAKKLGQSSNCWVDGFTSDAVKAAFPEKYKSQIEG